MGKAGGFAGTVYILYWDVEFLAVRACFGDRQVGSAISLVSSAMFTI